MTDTHFTRALAASTLAICLAVPALAQSDSTTMGSTGTTMPMGQKADQVTCAHLSAMDAKAMETTLYYIAGYKRGQTDALDLSGAGGGSETSAAGGGTTGTAQTDATSTETTTAMTEQGNAGTATTGAGSADTTTAMNQGGSDATGALSGSTAPDAATGTTAVGQTADSVSATGGAGMSDGTEIDGFFAIPVAQVTVACIDDPAQSVSDVIDQHRGTMNN